MNYINQTENGEKKATDNESILDFERLSTLIDAF